MRSWTRPPSPRISSGALVLQQLIDGILDALLALALLLLGHAFPPARECSAWPVSQKSVQPRTIGTIAEPQSTTILQWHLKRSCRDYFQGLICDALRGSWQALAVWNRKQHADEGPHIFQFNFTAVISALN